MKLLLALLAMLLGFMGTRVEAHELRPAYLELHEKAPRQFTVLWKVPAAGDRRLALYLVFPESCRNETEPLGSMEAAAYFERWTILCSGGLKGSAIRVEGLRATLTDVLARTTWADGSIELDRLTPEDPSLVLKAAQTPLEVARTYFALGVEHILGGIDHLLFVLALMLLIRDPWMLVKTITAFTVAHTITLTGAALGYFSLPQVPVEAVIALSIAFVAREVLMMQPGERRLSEAFPWLVAFTFGLLHGFGFAGALKEIGLPHSDVPLALFTFNVGVEAGQLLFVVAIVALYRLFFMAARIPVHAMRTVMGYAIGTAATLWLVERLAAFL